MWAGFSFVCYWKVDTFRYIKFHLSIVLLFLELVYVSLENFVVGFGRHLTIYNSIICIKTYGRVAVPIYVIYVK